MIDVHASAVAPAASLGDWWLRIVAGLGLLAMIVLWVQYRKGNM